MKTRYNIEIEQEAVGVNTYNINAISAKWDKMSFDIADYIDFHLMIENKDRDVTNNYIVEVKVLGKTDTMSDKNSIIFNNVQVTYKRNINIIGWKEIINS